MSDNINVNDVREAANRVAGRWPVYEGQPNVRRQYCDETAHQPQNFVGCVLVELGLPLPPRKRNTSRFQRSFHVRYQELTSAAVDQLQKYWDADVEDQQAWNLIVAS